MKESKSTILTRIRRTSVFFIVALALSGITAFPLETELTIMMRLFDQDSGTLIGWLKGLHAGVEYINDHYSFLSYGTDWLAFAHLVIALFFIGVYQDPIRNIWITKVGIMACLAVFPLAFMAGYIRGIPLFWQLIDCSFGAFGLIPLVIIYKLTLQLSKRHSYSLK